MGDLDCYDVARRKEQGKDLDREQGGVGVLPSEAVERNTGGVELPSAGVGMLLGGDMEAAGRRNGGLGVLGSGLGSRQGYSVVGDRDTGLLDASGGRSECLISEGFWQESSPSESVQRQGSQLGSEALLRGTRVTVDGSVAVEVEVAGHDGRAGGRRLVQDKGKNVANSEGRGRNLMAGQRVSRALPGEDALETDLFDLDSSAREVSSRMNLMDTYLLAATVLTS